MLVCDAVNTSTVHEVKQSAILTSAVKMTEHPTTDDVMREAWRCLHLGADAVITARRFHVVETLARVGIPIVGHLGLVPRKSTWVGGLRAVGETAREAIELMDDFNWLEEAGAFAVAPSLTLLTS